MEAEVHGCGWKGSFHRFRPESLPSEERIDKAAERGKLPYFIADNKRVVDDILKGGSNSENNREDDTEKARIEVNRREYERLKADPNYTDVEFNPKNGGLKATHVEHEKHTNVDKKRLALFPIIPHARHEQGCGVYLCPRSLPSIPAIHLPHTNMQGFHLRHTLHRVLPSGNWLQRQSSHQHNLRSVC